MESVKVPASRLRVDGRERRYSNTVMSHAHHILQTLLLMLCTECYRISIVLAFSAESIQIGF